MTAPTVRRGLRYAHAGGTILMVAALVTIGLLANGVGLTVVGRSLKPVLLAAGTAICAGSLILTLGFQQALLELERSGR